MLAMSHIENRVVAQIQLGVHSNVPVASQARFINAALVAKTNSLIARLLKNNTSTNKTLDL
jgi:hypothetical protein